MSVELKPCPFCGGEAELFEERIHFVPFRNLPWKGVRCTRCGGCYISTDIKTCLNDMRDAWNKRAFSMNVNQYGNNSKCIEKERPYYEALSEAIRVLNAQKDKCHYAKIVRCRECRWGHLCVTGQHLGLDGFCSKGEREVQE